jgi:glycosyltransferase involved in cell wall biosynthesis
MAVKELNAKVILLGSMEEKPLAEILEKIVLSCPRKRASINDAPLDSRFRGNDKSDGNDNEITKLHVIYEGVDEVFTKITDPAHLKSVKEKYKLPDKFMLYVGSIRRHKNIKALLDAFMNFRKRSPDISLVMVGRLSQDIDIKRNGVTYLGEIESDKELAAIYNLASCLFNLSLYEGFGLTILEAQRCGLPVVCSDIPVHKEIGGEGISAVKASYIDQISQNLYNVLSNKGIREALILRGFKNADRFSWRKTAQDTIGLYRKAGNEGSDSSRLALGNAGRRKDPQRIL